MLFSDLFAVLHRDHDGVHPDGDGGASVEVVFACHLRDGRKGLELFQHGKRKQFQLETLIERAKEVHKIYLPLLECWNMVKAFFLKK